MRIAFMGTPEIAAACLQALIDDGGFDIAAVYTRAPQPAHRGKKLTPSPVHRLAEAHGIEVCTPKTLKSQEDQDAFRALDLDAAVVVAYGLILPRPILEAPRLGCFNLHASLLPRWRGAAPIQRALMAGDAETGVQVMGMEEGLDTGPVYMTAKVEIEADETAGSLHDKLMAAGAAILPKALHGAASGELTAEPQSDQGVTYAHKIDKSEARIDWTRPAMEVDRQIRGLSPFPGAWLEAPDGKGGVIRLKALLSRVGKGRPGAQPGEALDDRLLIACGEGAVRLLQVQPAGKPPMDAEAYLNGRPVPAGVRLA